MSFIPTHNIRGDILGGITAGIIALPLALAFGEASGVGPIAGIWGAIIVGFFASLFGGTGAQISGPTGPMIVVFAGVYEALSGQTELIFTSVILAGVFMILLGIFRCGEYIRLVPYPVISGFMSGIGCIIIALQCTRLFGSEPGGSGTIAALQSIPNAIANPNIHAVALSVLTLIIVFFWPSRLAKLFPSPLAALVIVTIICTLFPGAPVLGDIPTGFPSLIMPALSKDTTTIIVEAAILLAILGSIDSLLTSLVADNMTRTRHHSNKELIGQGIGNSLAGFVGGIPGAGATMRTVINIRTGGKTKLSGMTHSLLLLAIVLALSPLAKQIPHAVLAGILVKVGYDIIDWSYLKRAHKGPRWDLLLMLLVLSLTVFVDLITAVAIGVVLAAMAFVKQIADLQLSAIQTSANDLKTDEEADLLKQADNEIFLFDFAGPLSFGAAADLGHRVRTKSVGRSVLILDFSSVPFLDISAVKAVETIASDAQESNQVLFISGGSKKIIDTLKAMGIDNFVPKKQWHKNRLNALKDAVEYLKAKKGK